MTERLAQAAGAAIVVGLGTVDPALVADPLGRATFVASPQPGDLAAAAGAIVRADAVVDRALLERMPNLRVLARTGVGVDLVDVAAATERGIAVVITPGSGTSAVAEAVVGMALHLAKRFGPLTDLVRSGGWAKRHQVAVGDLEDATIGIVGYGRIGQRVGQLARAFGMRVLAYDPVTIPPDGVRCARLSDIAAGSDVITLHTPLTETTRHLVDGRFLSAVKPGALLINCGRGALIDADAVLDALVARPAVRGRPGRLRPRAARPPRAVRPSGRGAHPAPDGTEPSGDRSDVRRRRSRGRRRAGRPRPAALANPAWTPAPPDDRPMDREGP